jgi:hypothetical protein
MKTKTKMKIGLNSEEELSMLLYPSHIASYIRRAKVCNTLVNIMVTLPL